jgi:hypothetical protein
LKIRVRVNEKRQKELLGGRTMDCSTGEGGKVKRVRIRIRIVMVMLIIQKKKELNKKLQVQEP